MTAHVPLRTWFNSRQGGFSSAQGLVIEPTDSSERFVGLWVAVDNDGPAIQLTAAQCREIARDLEVRARLIDEITLAEIFDGEEKAS